MVTNYFDMSIEDIANSLPSEGVSVYKLVAAAKCLGFYAVALRATFNDLKAVIPLPSIVFCDNSHYMVVYHIDDNFVSVCDPAIGRIIYSRQEFEARWMLSDEGGVVVAIEPVL